MKTVALEVCRIKIAISSSKTVQGSKKLTAQIENTLSVIQGPNKQPNAE